MIKFENVEVVGWEHAIRGMRNPKNSWQKSDSRECIYSCDDCDNFSVCNVNSEPYFKRFWEGGPVDCNFAIGPNDHSLMITLRNAGTDHRKFMRMITVYVDITAPLYFWKEFDTYKVGTVANSCSTMHKIHAKEFTMEDFSCEHLGYNDEGSAHCLMSNGDNEYDPNSWKLYPYNLMLLTIAMLNSNRNMYLETKDKKYWWQMIQLLPTSYNQKRTVMMNYEVLANMYKSRKDHKLDEWKSLCSWIETLPYSELITGEIKEVSY